MTVIAAGTPAPAFSLARDEGEPFTQADLRGTTTILVFYPFAFSPVCTDQLRLYQEALEEIHGASAEIYGVSCDSTWSQRAFREQLGVSIEQLSDFEPKGATCAAFGVLHRGGFPERAIVITDPEGIVRFSHQADSPGDLPGVNVIFDGLQAVSP